jgi:Zn-dependent peptidase ImmA (M78 family)
MARRPNRAEQAAIDLLDKNRIAGPPVDVEELAKKLGVDVRYEPFEGGLSGALYRADDGHAVLGVNDWHVDVRKRFTIAHELGHLLLHPDELFVDGILKRDGDSSLAIRSHEIEANAFAAELLMPRKLVLEEINEILAKNATPDAKRLVKQLANTFEVSEQAMQFKLMNLGLTVSV